MNLKGDMTCGYCDTGLVDATYWEDGTKPEDKPMCDCCLAVDMPREGRPLVVTQVELSLAVRAILEHLEEKSRLAPNRKPK